MTDNKKLIKGDILGNPEQLKKIRRKIQMLVGKLDNGSHSSNALQGLDEELFELFKQALKEKP